MDSASQPHIARSNRNLPVEQWPESLDILRHLASAPAARSVRDIACAVGAPEISTRNRLIRLAAAGALSEHRGRIATPSGKPSVGMHYRITQFGRDCVGARTHHQSHGSGIWENASSVFAWGSKPKSSC